MFLKLSSCASVGGKTLIIIKMHGVYVKINTPQFITNIRINGIFYIIINPNNNY
jgi:hypothetical protein